VDIHTHFMPPNVLAKVWAFFERGRAGAGRAWPIAYRLPEEARVPASISPTSRIPTCTGWKRWAASIDNGGFMAGLLLLAATAVVSLLYLADRAVKARVRARRLRRMTRRLDAAVARSEQQQARRQAADAASAELTTYLPAINRSPLTLPGQAVGAETPQD